MLKEVLVVDDEIDIRELVGDILTDEGYTPRLAASSMEALKIIEQRAPLAVILDIWLQGSELDGLGVLEIIKRKYPSVPVIIISGHGTIETAVSAIKMGAYDYIEKPFTEEKLLIVLKRACEAAKLRRENADLRRKMGIVSDLTGNSQVVSQLKSTIEKVASVAKRVLILGPAGSGKELVARLIHQKSKRHDPFIHVNISSLSQERLSLELFGGADVTGQKRVGVFERISKGTVFLDEVADLSPELQAKLLRFLQEQQFDRTTQDKNDIRLIFSSNRDLDKEVQVGRFKQDLLSRIHGHTVRVPSLKERQEDIPLLCQQFIKASSDFYGLPPRELAEDALIALQAYHWPANIRQLRNIIEWLLIMVSNEQGSPIRAYMLPSDILSIDTTSVELDSVMDVLSMPLREAREIFERQYLAAQIQRFNGNISKTSSFVGMERSALHRKLKSLNITTSSLLPEEDLEEVLETNA